MPTDEPPFDTSTRVVVKRALRRQPLKSNTTEVWVVAPPAMLPSRMGNAAGEMRMGGTVHLGPKVCVSISPANCAL